MNYLSFHLKKLEKEEQIKIKISGRGKKAAEINGIETRKSIVKNQ